MGIALARRDDDGMLVLLIGIAKKDDALVTAREVGLRMSSLVKSQQHLER